MATIRWWELALWASIVAHGFGLVAAEQPELWPSPKHITTKQAQRADRFLAQRSLNRARRGNFSPVELLQKARAQQEAIKASANDSGSTSLSAPWTPIGPSAVETSSYGLITGRITSL